MATQISLWEEENNYNDSIGSNGQAAAGSGNAHVQTLVARGAWSLALNGSGYASKTAAVTGITGGNVDKTMGLFFAPTTASSVEAIMAVGQATNLQGFTMLKLSATSMRIDLYADSLSYAMAALSNAVFYLGWVEYTATGKSARFYINTVESASGSQAFGSNSNLVANHIYLGANDDASLLFTGKVDHGTYYNGVTSLAERLAFFSSKLAIQSGSLGGFHIFSESELLGGLLKTPEGFYIPWEYVIRGGYDLKRQEVDLDYMKFRGGKLNPKYELKKHLLKAKDLEFEMVKGFYVPKDMGRIYV